MKTKKLLILIILSSLTLLMSCDSDDNDLTNIENYLIGGIWKWESSETFYYYDNEFDRSEISLNDTDSNKLSFKKDYVVIYESPLLITELNGNWELSEDESYLFTDLSYTSGSTSGYGTIYFFPQCKIIEINKNNMLLESMHDTYTYWSSETGNIKVTSFERSRYIKEQITVYNKKYSAFGRQC